MKRSHKGVVAALAAGSRRPPSASRGRRCRRFPTPRESSTRVTRPRAEPRGSWCPPLPVRARRRRSSGARPALRGLRGRKARRGPPGPEGPEGPPGAGATATVEQVESEVLETPPNVQAATSAFCPDGTVVTGGGFILTGGFGDLEVTGSHKNLNGWTVIVKNRSLSHPASFRALAICLDLS